MIMKRFIFITPEGTTFSPNGDEVENMQVIGTVENVENEWIFDSEFNVAEFLCYEIS